MSKKNREKWTMPPWMEAYRDFFTNTGGNSIERLMNNDSDLFTNAPLAALSIACISQVGLLERLHKKGLLATTPALPEVPR